MRSAAAARLGAPVRAALMLCALAAAANFASAQDAKPAAVPEKPTFIAVRTGINGSYKLGCWTPVEVDILAGGRSQIGQLVFSTVDADGIPCNYPPVAVQLTAGRTTTAVGYVRFGKSDPVLKASLLVEHDGLIEASFTTDQFDERPHLEYPLSTGDRLVVCVGRSSALRQVAGLVSHAGGDRDDLVVAQVDDVLQLPTRSTAYEAADAVLIAADSLERYAPLAGDAAPSVALRDYLEFGGRIFVVAGADAPTLLGPNGPLARICGLKTTEPVPLPRAAALENFVGGNKPLGVKTASLGQIRIPRADAKRGVVALGEGDLPLVVRQAVGFGAVTWIMVDLEHRLLAEWSGRGLMLAKTLGPTLGDLKIAGLQSSSGSTRTFNYGFTDLAGQLHQAIDQYAGVRVVPFFALALLVIVYIGLIGPGDYLLVRRVLKRTELTWLTFPAIVVVTSIAAYFAAVWLKGDQLRVHQADVIDCDAELGIVHGTTFAGVFSPVSQAYDVRLDPPAGLLASKVADGPPRTTWFGSPGEGLGGMHRRDLGPNWFTSAYDVAPDLSELRGAPIKVWSSKLFTSDWRLRTSTRLHVPLTETSSGTLSGTLTNPFTTALEPSLLCYGTTAYKVPALAPGASCDIESLENRDLQGLLANAEIVARKQRELSPGVRLQAHDVSSLDPSVILTKIMFYQALGASEHANLANDELTRLDFSELLKLRKAVLVASLGTSGSPAEPRLRVAAGSGDVAREHDLRRAIVRLTIPVEPAESAD